MPVALQQRRLMTCWLSLVRSQQDCFVFPMRQGNWQACRKVGCCPRRDERVSGARGRVAFPACGSQPHT